MDIIIFANGEQIKKNIIDKIFSKLSKEKMIIACDGAVRICENLNIKPDVIVGDFDSYHGNDEIEKIYLRNQDFTDLQKAIKFAYSYSPQRIIIFSAFGKRLDHTIANILTFYYQISQSIELNVYDNYGEFRILYPGKNFIKNIENKTVSFFSLSKIKDLELIGFKYNFSNNKSLDYFIGVSNIVEKDIAMVSFSEGRLIMYIPFSV